MRDTKIAPSLFAADIMCLGEQIRVLEEQQVDLLHVDVMDGSFVNRIAFGGDHIRMIKKGTKIPLDVHMMVDRPDRYIDDFIHAGADIITVHQESTVMLYHCLEKIRAGGKKAGVVLSPATLPETLEYVLELIDMVLIMTVNPGEGKQQFQKAMLPKIKVVKQIIGDRNIDIEVDGSIDDQTARLCRDAGANVFVSGGYAVTGELAEKVQILRQAIQQTGGRQ